jgi:DNA (cytosine-5)-methyltransferase 1
MRVAAGVDLDPHCRHPFEANCGAEFVCKDVTTVTKAELDRWYGAAEIRVLAGCAPCQPFSTYSQSRRTPDERWRLLREFERLAINARPEIVTMENVRGLADRPVWREFVGSLEAAGYYVAWEEVACERYGVPQTRRRLVLVASLLGPISLPHPSINEPVPTVKEAIAHLPPLRAGERDTTDPLHMASRLSPKNLDRIKASRPGGTWRDWPSDLRAGCHVRKSGETYPSVYGRMEWERPAPTITTQCYGFGNGRYGHPEQDRAISLREAAILQSFPPAYSFVPDGAEITFRNVGILIGNAVPPKLGEAIGRAIRNHVDHATRS